MDYLKDNNVTALLNWIYDQLSPGGKAILGQCHVDSPDRAFLDHIMDWHLRYRDEERMKSIFKQSKFGGRPLDIIFEDTGVQMYISCVKD